ncbi:MAG: nickel-dependent lactate racemase [Phascolarctobacterium sp.]|uniref:nickel-dependent lactate racemase n=1 Tax=Phascolarctobacterium sp. TaxID=2049039 RepID=UPI0026DD4220|nr:nickel-dependent lactate racemase [Phascolarctobacterium sp.]MDO4922305.1 nickel-dependent lactate racemase [Phascolarctobacterium sp.]
MKKYFLPIGKRQEEVLLPEEHVIYDIHGNDAQVCPDIVAATREAIRNPIGSKPLREIVRAGETVTIVVSDITRLCGTAEFLPVIVDELNSVGVKDEDITVIVATGTHRGHTPEEDVVVCGEEMVKRLKIVQHDSRKKEDMVSLGKTSVGNEVALSKYVVNADRVILTGAVTLHPFAGFGGGRKAIMPGVAAYDSIMLNHCMTMSPVEGGGCNKACDASLLEGNPIHQDMKEAAALLKPDFLVNTVFTPDGEISEIVAGHWYEAWEHGCKDLLAMGGVHIKQLADVVIASAGGYPKDLNLYQATKCHMNAQFAVKKGGIMIFTLDCPDIKEPAIFTDCFSRTDMEQFEKDIRANFTIPAFVAFKARSIVNDVTAYLVTRPENFDFVRKTGHIPCRTLAEAWEKAQEQLARQGKKDYTITIMGHASATLPILDK